MEIKIPPFIKSGDCIGVTAPSFGCTIEPYASKFSLAKKIFEDKGFRIKTGETVFMSDGKGISTSPEKAAKELEDFYCDKAVDAIISAGGGEMMCETAGFIDFEKLRAVPPKWFMGYSDNTNFIFPLVTISRTAGIYGPCISGFGKKWELTEEYSLETMTGKRREFFGFEKFQHPENDFCDEKNLENYVYNLTEESELAAFRKNGRRHEQTESIVRMEGLLLGGCLDVLANIAGTKLDNMKQFNSDADKIIWVLESCDANPMELRRQLWHLRECGWFDKASGFVFGRPLASFRQTMMGVDQYDAVLDILAGFDTDIIMNADVGHTDPVIPLIMGTEAEITVQGKAFSLKYLS